MNDRSLCNSLSSLYIIKTIIFSAPKCPKCFRKWINMYKTKGKKNGFQTNKTCMEKVGQFFPNKT